MGDCRRPRDPRALRPPIVTRRAKEAALNERVTPISNATLADVAAAAGVGESTVSRVLRNHGSFSAKTRTRVLAAAASLGYVPNKIAGTLASAGSRLVASSSPRWRTSSSRPAARRQPMLEAEGYQSVIAVSEYDTAREEEMIASMLAWRPAALMIAGLEHSPAARGMLAASSTRVLELMDLDGPSIDIAVGYSNVEVGRTTPAICFRAAIGASPMWATIWWPIPAPESASPASKRCCANPDSPWPTRDDPHRFLA